MPTRPTKLNTAASASAAPGVRQRVETALAMALGASVAPEMMVTPMTSARMPSRTGWSPACERNTERVNSMPEPYPDEADRTQTHLPILAQRLHARKMTLRVNSNPGCGRTGVVSLRAPCGRAAKNVGTRGKFTRKRARAVLYWAGLPIGGKCKYLLAPETCLLHRDPCFCKRTWYVSTIMTKGPRFSF